MSEQARNMRDWSDGVRFGLERAAAEADKRAERHEQSVGHSSIDALHGAMGDAYRGFAARLRRLKEEVAHAND
jgi:hypothetical protein